MKKELQIQILQCMGQYEKPITGNVKVHLILFYIFSKEAEFSEYETNPSKLETLKNKYLEIIEHLDKLVQNGELSDFDRTTLLETANDVIKEIAKKYRNVVEGVGKVMGGALLETNA